MTRATSTAIALAVWSIGLIPATLVMQWLGIIEASWRGFFTGFAILAAISFSYELFQRWVELRLGARSAAKSGASSEH